MLKKHTLTYKSYISYIYSILAGISLVFAFAPFNYWILACIAPVVLFAQLSSTKKKSQNFILGLCFGIGLFGVGASWIYVSIHKYGNTNISISVFLTALFVLFMSLFYALLGIVYSKLSKHASIIKQSIIFSSLWILFEYMRANILTGFPWLLIGSSSVDSPFISLVPILGAYGIGFLFILSGCFIYLKQRISKLIFYVFFISLVSITLITSKIAWTSWDHSTTNIVLIQGNITQTQKWSAANEQNIIKTYTALTQPYWKAGNVIIWPESAITWPLPYSDNLIKQFQKQAKLHNSSLILGIPKANKLKTHYYNALLSLNKNDNWQFYLKQHLVPFGEYLPLQYWLHGLINFFNIPMSNFIIGSNKNSIIKAQQLFFKPAICYEIAYSDLVLSHLNQANAIITVSVDTWFGKSLGPYQHLQLAQMRALETGRYVVRSTNDGFTAIINTQGEIIKTIPRFKPGILETKIKGYTGITPLMYYKNKGIILLIIVMLIFVCSISNKYNNVGRID